MIKRIVEILVFSYLSTSFALANVVIAHRGASGVVPENTLVGVGIAHTWGVDYIEADLVLTKDDELIVFHDNYLDAVTDVAQKFKNRARKDGKHYVIDFTLTEIRKLLVHERINLKNGKQAFPKRFQMSKSHFIIPTFQDFIDLVKELNRTTGKDIGIYPEIKLPEFHQKEGKDITKAVFKSLESNGYNNKAAKVFVQSFFPPALKRLKEDFEAKFPLILLVGENNWGETSIDFDELKTKAGLSKWRKYINGVGAHIPQLVKINKNKIYSSGFAEAIHSLNLSVHAYTHRTDQQIDSGVSEDVLFKFLLKDLKIEGVFSDFGNTAIKLSR